MGRSDSRSALPRFAGALLIGLAAPSPPPGWHPRVFTPGAETGLSCSHIGCPTIPRPLRRRVLRGCISKRFTPSMAFAHHDQARLPLGPSRGGISSRRGRLRFMLRTGGLHPPSPRRARPRASTPRSLRTLAGCYKGGLAPPLTGLAPASRCELAGRTVLGTPSGDRSDERVPEDDHAVVGLVRAPAGTRRGGRGAPLPAPPRPRRGAGSEPSRRTTHSDDQC